MVRTTHHPLNSLVGLLVIVLLLCIVTARANDPAPTTAPAGADPNNLIHAEYRQYVWHRDEPPVKMIAKDEGFCFLSEVGGHFAGDGEAASVYIADDGYWYLGGHAAQGLWAKAYSIKFARKLAITVLGPADPDQDAWAAVLQQFQTDADPAIQSVARREASGLPADALALIALSDAWDAATKNAAAEQRAMVEPHLVHLYDSALEQLTGAARDTLSQRVAALRISLANRNVNDLRAWHEIKGKWSVTPEGKIEGSGDSQLALNHPLPPDCLVEMHVAMVSGMRTRMLFPGTELFIGNEGFQHEIEVHGAETQRGIPLPYVNGDEFKFGIKFKGKDFEFYVNDNLVSTGTRKAVPEKMGLALRSGDDWDGGTARFWDLKISPAQ